MALNDLIGTATETMPLAVSELAVNLIVGAALAYIVRLHFFRYSNALTNRTEFTSVLPFIILTTILIISIVKSSLALSLGLVGALSIVRFRTPIKEPEELAYLFISIAIGLGLGANQVIATIMSSIFILFLMIFFMGHKKLNAGVGEIYMNISGQLNEESQINHIQNMIDRALNICDRVSLKRYIDSQNEVDLTFYLSSFNPKKLDSYLTSMKNDYPNLSITILDQRNLPPL